MNTEHITDNGWDQLAETMNYYARRIRILVTTAARGDDTIEIERWIFKKTLLAQWFYRETDARLVREAALVLESDRHMLISIDTDKRMLRARNAVGEFCAVLLPVSFCEWLAAAVSPPASVPSYVRWIADREYTPKQLGVISGKCTF